MEAATAADDIDEVLEGEGQDEDEDGADWFQVSKHGFEVSEDDDDDITLQGPAYSGHTGQRAPQHTADRAYFGEETWGVSARQRSAEIQPAQLARYQLPVLRSEVDLATWLGIPLSRLRWYTHDRPAERTWHYVRYAVPKRSGQGERVILAPRRELKALQRKVLKGIVAKVPVAATTHGFVAGRSTLSNASEHAGKGVVLKLDLKDFFPSVTFRRVRGLFTALGYSYAVASVLALLCTEYDRQPFERSGEQYYISVGPRHLVQGAPTSPGLANLVAWRLDRRLAGLASKRGFVYTRYADDLTFSGEDAEAAARLGAAAARIIADEQFTVNAGKTRLLRRGGRQTVTGLVVNASPATPRELRRRLRAILHNAARDGLDAQNREDRGHYAAYLGGLIAYVGSANPSHGDVLRRQFRRLVTPRE
ncbi:MAG: RNA-directed DNA polymerase [Chloroflexi bacterium]|nr:MAG: RNA-directed DNA polymerase [Chloroflexota bacterium]